MRIEGQRETLRDQGVSCLLRPSCLSCGLACVAENEALAANLPVTAMQDGHVVRLKEGS